MYTVRVRDRIMIAHSFKGEIFGPAQALHGATFVIDVELRRPELTEDGIAVDIGRAMETLHAICGAINYQNLDALAMFDGVNTTTEVIARWVYDRMRAAIGDGLLGPGAEGLTALKVEIAESDVAWAGFEGPLP
jgi:6-pyruvoyl-tetrahydropterin synthase